MANTITIKKDVLFLEGKVNNIKAKDGSEITYVSAVVLVKEDKCKLECSMKLKPEEFLKKDFKEYETYNATLEITISDKVKVKILELVEV